MSWLFSRALVEEFSEGICLDGEPSVQSNGNPTQLVYLPPDRMTAFSRLSQFGMTFKPLTENRGQELLTSYLAAFHAKTLAQQEKAMDSTEKPAPCGDTWQGSLAKFDHDSCSWKTPQCSLFGGGQESLQTLPRSGMTRDGLLWEQTILEPVIVGKGFGYWPTPTATDWKATGKLETLKRQGDRNEAGHQNRPQYEYARKFNMKMPLVASEILMMWPLEWTDLKPLEMDKFQEWQQQHSHYYQNL